MKRKEWLVGLICWIQAGSKERNFWAKLRIFCNILPYFVKTLHCDLKHSILFVNMKAVVIIVLFSAAICSHVNGELTKISDLVDRAALFEDWLVDTRRELHQYPELMFEVRHNPPIF